MQAAVDNMVPGIVADCGARLQLRHLPWIRR